MTASEKPAFRAEIVRAGAAFQTPVDDALMAVYFDALRDLDLDVVREAFTDCVLVLKWFPKVADLRDASEGVKIRRESQLTKRLIAASPKTDRLYAYDCQDCEDTGFVRGLSCPGDGRCAVAKCGQPGHVNYPHDYTRKCHCRATNPTLRKQREYLASRHHTKEAADGRARPR